MNSNLAAVLVIVAVVLSGALGYVIGQRNTVSTIVAYCDNDGVYLENGLLMRCATIKSDVK